MIASRIGWMTCTAIAAAMLGCGGKDAPVAPSMGTANSPSAMPMTAMPVAPATGSAGSMAAGGGTPGKPPAAAPTNVANNTGTPAVPAGAAGAAANGAGGAGASAPVAAAAAGCDQREVATGEPQLHYHHVHFNTTDPSKDIEFFMKFYNGMPIDFCKDKVSGEPTRAIKTERAYFLFTVVETPADPALNSHVDHVGFANPNPTNELRRLMMLGVPLWTPGDQLQCQDVADGNACFSGAYFYTQAPSGARIEVSNSPGPSTMGFGHTHFSGPMPDFYMQLLGPALQNAGGTMHVDGVNMTNTLLENRAPESPVDTKGKPMDHLAFSTTDIMATMERIKGAGINIEEELSFKPAFGFKSFMVKSPQGVWIEIVEDTPFKP